MVTVIEQTRVPEFVSSFGSFVKVLVVWRTLRKGATSSIELVETIKYVFAGVGVDNVKEDGDTVAMRRIDESLELLWCTETTRRREKVCYLIAKRGIVRMLHDCHNLDTIISLWESKIFTYKICDSREDVSGEFWVGSDLSLWTGNTNMSLVYRQGQRFFRTLMNKLVFLRIPKHTIVHGTNIKVLNGPFDVSLNQMNPNSLEVFRFAQTKLKAMKF